MNRGSPSLCDWSWPVGTRMGRLHVCVLTELMRIDQLLLYSDRWGAEGIGYAFCSIVQPLASGRGRSQVEPGPIATVQGIVQGVL